MTANGGTNKNKPFDLDAAAAARREAEGTRFRFTFKGKEYECLPAKEWPISVSGLLAEGNLVGALGDILGEEQGEAFLAGKPTMGDVEDLMTEIAKFSGVSSAGE